MKVRVFVTLKPSVFDPQGHTIAEALHSMGYANVGDVRQGKFFELDLDVASAAAAEKLASELADRVLANPVIESYRVELTDGVPQALAIKNAARTSGASGEARAREPGGVQGIPPITAGGGK